LQLLEKKHYYIKVKPDTKELQYLHHMVQQYIFKKNKISQVSFYRIYNFRIVLLMYCYSNDYSQRTTMVKADIGRAQTVVDWFNFFREVVGRFLVMHATEIGDIDDQGQPIIVEIDETKYFHRKYHRMQWRKGHWVFGGIEGFRRSAS